MTKFEVEKSVEKGKCSTLYAGDCAKAVKCPLCTKTGTICSHKDKKYVQRRILYP